MSDKLIKLSDAIDVIKKNHYRLEGHGLTEELLLEQMCSIPSADRWIPCAEREPNEFEDVLVLLSDGTMDVLQLTDYLDICGNVKWCHAVHHGLGYSVSGNDVVAWMPLPEPRKGADDERG